MKVTILEDGRNPFYDVIFTETLKYLADVNKRVVDLTEGECERIRRFTKEMDSIQDWLEKKFNST